MADLRRIKKYPLKRLIEAGFDAPDPQSKQFAELETYQLDRVDNLLKILQNVEGQKMEISTPFTIGI